MKYKLMLLFFLSLFFSQKTLASCEGYQCINVQVSDLFVTTTQTLVGTTGDEKLLSCDANQGKYLFLNADEKNYSALYALLLSSHMSKTPLTVRTSNTGKCYIAYVVSYK